jgi:hypothetical protein
MITKVLSDGDFYQFKGIEKSKTILGNIFKNPEYH